MMSPEVFDRLTKRGKRRAIIVDAISCVLWAGILFGVGYLCCAVAAGLEVLAGVWG